MYYVEEKKRRVLVTRPEKPQRVEEGYLGAALFFPCFRNRRMSFRVNASLRAASLAESCVDLGDRCPTPVLEKVGAAL